MRLLASAPTAAAGFSPATDVVWLRLLLLVLVIITGGSAI